MRTVGKAALVVLALLLVGLPLAWPPKRSAHAQSPEPPQGRGFLGVQVASIPKGKAAALNLPEGKVVVVHVLPGSAAEKAGIRRGDILTQARVGTTTVPLERPSDLHTLLRNTRPGDEVTLWVERNGATQEVTVALGERPRLAEKPYPFPLPPFFFGWWERLLGGQVRVQGPDNTVRTYTFYRGTVTATSTDAIVVRPADGGAEVRVPLTQDVQVMGGKGWKGMSPADIPLGTTVTVIAQDGAVRWVVLHPPAGVDRPWRPFPKGPRMGEKGHHGQAFPGPRQGVTAAPTGTSL